MYLSSADFAASGMSVDELIGQEMIGRESGSTALIENVQEVECSGQRVWLVSYTLKSGV